MTSRKLLSALNDQMLQNIKDCKKKSARAIVDLLGKTDDLENRLRCNYLRIVGVTGKLESLDPNTYFENWLIHKFGKKHLTPLFAVEHVHRVHTRPLSPGLPTHPVIVKGVVQRLK